MRKLLLLTLTLITLLALIMFGIRLISAGGKAISAANVLDVTECSQPCWHGIRPGITTIDQANTILQSNKLLVSGLSFHAAGVSESTVTSLCWTVTANQRWQGCAIRDRGPTGPINRVELRPSTLGMMTLGQAVVLFGTPIASQLCVRLGFVYAAVYFPGDVEVQARYLQQLPPLIYSMDMPVYLIRYHYPAAEPPYAFDTPHWRGFIRLSQPDNC